MLKKKFLSLAAIMVCVLCAGQAHADANDPILGHCLTHEADGKTCSLSEHFSAIVPMFTIDLRSGSLSSGVDAGLGACRGLTFNPTRWWSSGVDACVSFHAGQNEPYRYAFSLLGFFANYGAAGAGVVNTSGAWGFFAYVAPRLPVQ